MVFISRGRGRGGNRGRGRGVGEVAFESRASHDQGVGRDSRQGPESLRITVGNDQFKDRNEDPITGRLSPNVSQRLGPPKESYIQEQEAVYRREDAMYRREAELYGRSDRERFERERERDYERREHYTRDPYVRPEEREYGDRRGLGGGNYEQPPADFHHQPSQPLFPSATRSPPRFLAAQPAVPSPVQASTASRPLKSILKKKSEPVPEEKAPLKPSGLPGIANYMDDIEDEDRFLYGGDDERNGSDRDRRDSGQFRQQPQGIPVENMRANMRSAANTWQPTAPQNTVSNVVSEFVNAQREYVDNSKSLNYGRTEPYHSQPVQPSAEVGDNDLWSMLAKSVQTVQQQQQNQANQYEAQPGSFKPPFSAQSAHPTFPNQPTQDAQTSATAHDPTIENILKSIGFDFEMSKRMQEKAKQSSGDVLPQARKPGDPQFINQTASFIGSQMSHEEMISKLGPSRGREAPVNVNEREQEPVKDDLRERELYDERTRRGSSEASRGRLNSPPRRQSSPSRRTDSPPRRFSSPSRMLSSPPRGQSPEKLQRGCSPISAEGSPPPPIFNLPPITIKRRSNIEHSRSPGWEKKRSLSRSPTRDSDRSRNRPRSRSPSWNRSISSYGRKRSPSPNRIHSGGAHSPGNHSRSPTRRMSPVINRTFNLDELNPVFRRRVSPTLRERSLSPVSPERSLSPGRRRTFSPGRRSVSPRRRRSSGRRSPSPVRRRSNSPGRRRSPGRRSRSPGRRRSPKTWRNSRSPGRKRSPRRRSPSPRGRRRSLSPRGRKRGASSRSRSRERKLRRSTSRDKTHRGSPGRGRRSSSRDRSRKRSRSWSRSSRKRKSFSVSSDSDVDGPANKQYFSSPLRLSHGEKQKIPRFYDNPPQQQGPPPDFFAQPFPGYGPPPGSFPPGTQPGMAPMCPPGPPPMMNVPPPGMGPPIGPPVSFPYPPPAPPGNIYAVPGAPSFSQPPPVVPESDMAPPGTVEMPLNLPVRPNLTEIVNEVDKEDTSTKKKEALKGRRRERSGSREKPRDKNEERRNEKSSSGSSRIVLPLKTRPKAEDIEIKASTTSNERVVVLGGKSSKSSPSVKASKKVDQAKDKAKILKEKESMANKIKALEKEFDNLKKQEFDLRQRPGKDNKPDPILMENKKLLEEIKKEIAKLNKQKNDFESRHSAILKTEGGTKREIKVTPKKSLTKDEKSKTGDKKTEKEEFKVEKGKLMKHYFLDSGDHWCKPCNTVHPNIQDYMHHLASYKHKQTLPSDFRPWMDGYKANDGMIINKKGIRVHLPGIEFMMPVTAYYCELCKVFLGDVSFGADHFKCESHYINYKKYLADNPLYEKKYKEERDKALSQHKTVKKVEQQKKAQKDKDEVKQKNSEKDARVRENEKKWDKSVDDLDDNSSSGKKQETSKNQIKVSLKDQKNENSEKGFGKFNWTKDKKAEEQKNGQKTPEAGQEKDKGKINFNISLTGKTGRSVVSKTGVQKKNPLLPPWQPVGKKSESLGKTGGTASLDQFLTTNTGEGKIPVISEKKKVSAKEILEAFSGKYKEKEIGPSPKKESDEEKMEVKEKLEKTEKEKVEEEDKRMMGIDPDTEVPLAEKKPPPPVSLNVPLPDQKPSATIDDNSVHKVFNTEMTENILAPVSVTIDLEEIPDSDKIASISTDVKEIPMPVAVSTLRETEEMTDVPVFKKEAMVKQSVELADIPVPETEETVIKTVSGKDLPFSSPVMVGECELEELQNIMEITSEKPEESFGNQDSSEINTETKLNVVYPESDLKIEKESEDAFGDISDMLETILNDPKIDLDVENVEDLDVSDSVDKMKKDFRGETNEQPNEEKDKADTKINTDTPIAEEEYNLQISKTVRLDKPEDITLIKVSVKEAEISQLTGIDSFHLPDNDLKEADISLPAKIGSDHLPNVKKGEMSSLPANSDSGHLSNNDFKEKQADDCVKANDGEKTDGSSTETEETVSPSPPARGRGRGRGRKRGRGRGRGKAKTTPVRSTRSTRAAKAAELEEESVDFTDFENNKCVLENVDSTNTSNDSQSKDSKIVENKVEKAQLNETNKDSKLLEKNKESEFNLSVQVPKPEGSKSKKSTSPRKRKTSVKTDSLKTEIETSDKEDTPSEASGISMDMDSDFEVVDDLEDMEVLDEAN